MSRAQDFSFGHEEEGRSGGHPALRLVKNGVADICLAFYPWLPSVQYALLVRSNIRLAFYGAV